MFTTEEKENIKKYFGVLPGALDKEEFEKKRRALRSKYHPDNFAKFDDETVLEMAKDRFQLLEHLSKKIAAGFADKPAPTSQKPESDTGKGTPEYAHINALFAYRKLKVEILTPDKDLKYHLFGTRYRWLTFGESFDIPNTEATIIIDESHSRVRIGFQESIRMYLTFGEGDSIEDIVGWLFSKIEDNANGLIVAGTKIEANPAHLITEIKKHTFLRIGPPAS